MKLIGFSFVMAALLLAGCQKPVADRSENDWEMPAVVIVTPPPPSKPDYAPRGVFFLLAPVRKETRDGIIRLLPGTEVKLLRNGKYQTPEGEMALDPRILTNDRTAARAAENADKKGQAFAFPKPLPAAPVAVAPANPAPRPPMPAATPPSPMASAPPPALAAAPTENPAPAYSDEKMRAMKFRLRTLKTEEAQLQANVIYLSEKARGIPQSLRTPGSPTGLSGSTSLSDWNVVNDKLNAVQAEIRDLEAKLQVPAN
jgi:hypothetical protein